MIPNVHYDLVLNGKRYPPKYVVSLAVRLASGKELPAGNFNAVEAKDYFLSRGYEVIDRREEAGKIIIDENDESDFPEGRERYSLHRRLERDSKIARKAKANRLAESGALECEVCGLDFYQKYGDLGKGFIEAHHIRPVASLCGEEKTKISDFSLVCSNCHRMLHRGKKLLAVGELRSLINKNAIT
jgi:predicted HNH restriction endonuclease